MLTYACRPSRLISDPSRGRHGHASPARNGDGDGISCPAGKALKLRLACLVVGIALPGSGRAVLPVGKVGSDIGEREEVVRDVGHGGRGCRDGGDEACGCGAGTYSADATKRERRVNG